MRASRTHAVLGSSGPKLFHLRRVDADVGDESTDSCSVVKLFEHCETIPKLADQHLPRDLVPRRCGLQERNPLVS